MGRSIAETFGLNELGMVIVLVVIAVLLAVITHFVSARRARPAAQAPEEQPQAAPAPEEPAAPVPEGPVTVQCKLTNCDEPTAALIIAIVADSLGDDFKGMQVTSIKQL